MGSEDMKSNDPGDGSDDSNIPLDGEPGDGRLEIQEDADVSPEEVNEIAFFRKLCEDLFPGADGAEITALVGDGMVGKYQGGEGEATEKFVDLVALIREINYDDLHSLPKDITESLPAFVFAVRKIVSDIIEQNQVVKGVEEGNLKLVSMFSKFLHDYLQSKITPKNQASLGDLTPLSLRDAFIRIEAGQGFFSKPKRLLDDQLQPNESLPQELTELRHDAIALAAFFDLLGIKFFNDLLAVLTTRVRPEVIGRDVVDRTVRDKNAGLVYTYTTDALRLLNPVEKKD